MTIHPLWFLFLMLLTCSCQKATQDVQSPTATSTNNPDSSNPPNADPTNDHGERQQLDDAEVFGRSIKVVQLGDVEAGHEAAFELQFESGKVRITTVRGWIGIESGIGSMKSLFMLENKQDLHGHVDAPKIIPKDSKLWLEFELDGKRETAAITYK
jgi:hypothetical protein